MVSFVLKQMSTLIIASNDGPRRRSVVDSPKPVYGKALFQLTEII